MALAKWPSALGAPQLSDFSVSGSLPVKRTEMQSNRPRTFRISKTIMRDVQVSFYFSDAQLALFWIFFETGGNAGADWFEMPLRVGNSLEPHIVRFKSLPSQSVVRKNKSKVSFVIETDQQKVISQ